MRDAKAFASLSSSLLARKGQARPAMRPQGFGQAFGQPDDLGWNDMGHDAPRMAAAPAVPEVLRQQDEIAREFAVPAAPPASLGAAEPVVIDRATVESPETGTATAEPIGFVPAAQPRRRSDRKARAKAGMPVAAPRTDGRKAAFTLRLEAERHLLLRLACAVQNRSAQQIVVEALDRLLADLSDIAKLAASLPRQD